MLVQLNSFQTNVKFPQMRNLYKTKYLTPLLLHVELTKIAPCNKETVLHRRASVHLKMDSLLFDDKISVFDIPFSIVFIRGFWIMASRAVMGTSRYKKNSSPSFSIRYRIRIKSSDFQFIHLSLILRMYNSIP